MRVHHTCSFLGGCRNHLSILAPYGLVVETGATCSTFDKMSFSCVLGTLMIEWPCTEAGGILALLRARCFVHHGLGSRKGRSCVRRVPHQPDRVLYHGCR